MDFQGFLHIQAGPLHAWRPLCYFIRLWGILLSGRGGGCAMEDLPGLKHRARELRQRIADFLDDFGRDLVPELRQLHDELAQIEQHLRDLGEHSRDD